jgi:two-component system nitrogen regulation sensor histidine kinase GlnL
MATEPSRHPFAERHSAADVLDALNAGVMVLDEELRVLEANSAAQDLLGVSVNQARGRHLSEWLGAPPEFCSVLERALANAEACAQREVILQPLLGNGGERVADVSVTPFDAARPARRLVVEVSDATQRQRISRETALLAQLGGSRLMVRQLANYINNPLGGLRGAAQHIERQLMG